jgi:N-methylhydantoinase A
MLMTDIQHDYVRTYYRALDQADFQQVQSISQDLVERGTQTLAGEAVDEEAMGFQKFLDIRYTGQEFSIPVPIPDEFIDRGNVQAIRKAFNDLHERRYGYHTPEQPVEIVNIRLRAIGRRKKLEFPSLELRREEPPQVSTRKVYFEGSEKPLDCPIYRREKLGSGVEIVGPAIIQEYASTTVLFPGDRLKVAETGELVIHLSEVTRAR